MDAELKKLSEKVREAARSKRALRLRGGGTKDFYGQALEGEVLDTRGYSAIVSYEPSELVITARCGTRLSEVEAAMRERGQMLAFEPPHFARFGSDGATLFATVGGAVAAGLSGPGRQAAGALRDFVLGTKIMDGRGEVLTFGGQVMKNVAGYDVSRLMAGSLGTLGIILEVSLKALPLPAAEATLRFELPEDRAIEQLNRWGGKPLPISASAWNDGTLGIRLSGVAAAVKAAREKLGGGLVETGPAERFWAGVREQTDRFFRDDTPLWRISVPSTTPPLKLQGEQLIEWGGALRWLHSHADARTVREAAKRAGGHATLFRGGDKAVGVFQPLAPALVKVHKQLKREFDPQGVFNRGRMYPEL
ncbi:MAG TPA: glycolate oxidase subunit GlcE [Burkholderiales bacterium]|nr:glycolate oxidase subunit GlcE [Burkholderiales bacterium]